MTLRYPDGVQSPRQRGRPRVEEPLERVSTRLPLGVYDQLVRAANQRETSVSMLVRQLIVMRLKD
jgi:hypothetical protein